MKPVKKYIAGQIQVAVWENGEEGKTFPTISITKRYKDKNEEWKNSSSFRIQDIPKAIAAMQKAYTELTVREIGTGTNLAEA